MEKHKVKPDSKAFHLVSLESSPTFVSMTLYLMNSVADTSLVSVPAAKAAHYGPDPPDHI